MQIERFFVPYPDQGNNSQGFGFFINLVRNGDGVEVGVSTNCLPQPDSVHIPWGVNTFPTIQQQAMLGLGLSQEVFEPIMQDILNRLATAWFLPVMRIQP